MVNLYLLYTLNDIFIPLDRSSSMCYSVKVSVLYLVVQPIHSAQNNPLNINIKYSVQVYFHLYLMLENIHR